MSAPAKVTTVEQATFVVPDLSVKDLLSVIPAHCFERSALKSSLYMYVREDIFELLLLILYP